MNLILLIILILLVVGLFPAWPYNRGWAQPLSNTAPGGWGGWGYAPFGLIIIILLLFLLFRHTDLGW